MTFLEELKEQAKKFGQQTMATDYAEVRDFVKWCFEKENKKPPTDEELKPYQ